MAGIKVGDNGTVFELPIRDNGAVVPLSGASVSIVIKNGDRRFIKDATVKDAANGVCEITLTSTDLAAVGLYTLQCVVRLQNGNEFASDVEKFMVDARI